VIPLDTALAAYQALPPLSTECLPTAAALGRVLAADAHAAWPLPRHHQSALDGYLVAAEDAQAGKQLRVSGAIAAGQLGALPALERGSALRIFTGARLPAGLLPAMVAVIGQERCERYGDVLRLQASFKPAANIRQQGEEAAAGSLVLGCGERLKPGQIAALISSGVAQVRVYRAPRVAVLVTGDELRPAGSALEDGQIWDSNGPLVQSWLRQRGLSSSLLHLADDRAASTAMLASALAGHDVVISTGGVSVGEHDHLIPAAKACGVAQVFWRVAQKPGKPLFFGCWQGGEQRCLVLGLPGNPGAVLLGLALHAARLLDQLEGVAQSAASFRAGVLTGSGIKTDPERERLVRMRLRYSEQGLAQLEPLPYQDSHMLSNLDRASALVRIPAQAAALTPGAVLQWLPL
jgi:molybdopterin molybdotransferase